MAIDVFLEKSLRLESGETIELPKLTWKREIKVYKIIGDALNKIPALKEIKGELQAGDLIKIISSLLMQLPDEITRITEILTGKNKEWIEENMTFEDISNLIFPFLNKFTQSVVKHAEKIKLKKL